MVSKKKQDSVWDKARKLTLTRYWPDKIPKECDPYELDKGVNYFVLMLDQLGAKTMYSCEGHPQGFYVMFKSTYSLARSLDLCGYWNVQLFSGKNTFAVYGPTPIKDNAERNRFLRQAAEKWDEVLGPLDWHNIKLVR